MRFWPRAALPLPFYILFIESGDIMANIGVPYESKHLFGIPDFFADEQDPQARGVRRKRARYNEIVAKIMNMTADFVKWPNLSEYLPDMPPTTIEEYTQSSGWSALIEKDGNYHLVSGICGGFLGEWTEYFMPRGVIVSNAYAPEIEGTYIIGENAVLLRNDTHMQGLFPIICPRAEMMVENDISILIGLENMRVINMIHAATDSMKEAALSFLRQIRWGRHGIITGRDSQNRWSGAPSEPVIENLPTGGVPTNYLIQMIEAAQYERASLFNDLGLQYNSNMKREALNSAETTMNEDILHPIIDNMMECRRRFCEECKTVFGIDITPPELQGAWAQRKAEIQTPENEPEPEAETPPEKEGGEPDGETENN